MPSKALLNALRYFQVRDGELLVGGAPISELATQNPTPFYVYDLTVAKEKYERLRCALPRDIEIHYAIKANPHPGVIRFFQQLGLGFDVASIGELRRAQEAGVSPAACGFAGPGKSHQEIEYAIQHGIGALNVESQCELAAASRIAEHLRMKAHISLRVNPTFSLVGSGMRIGGGPQPFGIDQEQIPVLLDRLRDMHALHFRGFHLFAGSQNLAAKGLVDFFGMSFNLLKGLMPLSPTPPTMINLGGGFGIPYFSSEDALDIEAVGDGLARLLETHRFSFPTTRFAVESGRYLIGESGIYVTRVRYRKVSRGETFLVVDGGLHHHLAASGNFGQVIRRNYPVAALQKLDTPATETANVVGPLCTPLDRLATAVEMPTLREGDLIGIFASGAYGFTASPRGFLSHPEPLEIIVGPRERR
jgi:diaminopimelate decarboxylase